MNEMEWLNVVSNGCIFFTIVMFSTGIPECLRMIRQRNTNNIPYLPYLMTNVNCICWIIYGEMTSTFTIIVVNAIGCILQTIYMCVFVYFSSSKKEEIQRSLLAAALLFIGWSLTNRLMSNIKLATYIVGMLCCTITILMFASPLAEINTVITKKSTATISFPLTVASCVCASMWTVFGLLIKDTFVVFPNAVGVATSIARFCLFWKYPSDTSPTLPL